MQAIERQATAPVTIGINAIPAHENDALCRTVISGVKRMFEDPAVIADYVRWQKERRRDGGRT